MNLTLHACLPGVYGSTCSRTSESVSAVVVQFSAQLLYQRV